MKNPQRLMHFHLTGSDAAHVVVKLDVRVVSKQGHWNGTVGEVFGNHECSQALAKWIIVVARVPNGDFFGLPCFIWPDGNGLPWNMGKVTAAGCACILDESDWV